MSEFEPLSNVDDELLNRLFGTPEEINPGYEISSQNLREKFQNLAQNRSQAQNIQPEMFIDEPPRDESEDA